MPWPMVPAPKTETWVKGRVVTEVLHDGGHALATPTHRVASRSGRCAAHGVEEGREDAVPEQPRGCPRAMAPCTLTLPVEAELAMTPALGGEGLVELDEVEVFDGEARALQRLAGGGHGPKPMTSGSTPAAAQDTSRAMG